MPINSNNVKSAIPAVDSNGTRGVRVTYIDGSTVFVPVVSF